MDTCDWVYVQPTESQDHLVRALHDTIQPSHAVIDARQQVLTHSVSESTMQRIRFAPATNPSHIFPYFS